MITKLMDGERMQKFTNLEFQNLPRYPNGDLDSSFWSEDFIWLTNSQKNRITNDDQSRLFDCQEELDYDLYGLGIELNNGFGDK